MTATINLKFNPPSTQALAGIDFGKKIYKEQVAEILSNATCPEKITIRFPKSIHIIGASFWQGFIENMINEIGYDGIRERVNFVTSSDELTELLYEAVI